jgi:hypothetical protein
MAQLPAARLAAHVTSDSREYIALALLTTLGQDFVQRTTSHLSITCFLVFFASMRNPKFIEIRILHAHSRKKEKRKYSTREKTVVAA